FVCGGLDELGAFCEEVEAAFLLLQMPDNQTKTIQKNLNACRSLRIPYILWKNDFEKLATEKILVPIGFLEEEIEKAQFAAAFGRFFGSEITLLQAKDYGSKAATTTAKMKTLLDKFSLKYDVQLAENDSFKIDKEAVKVAEKDAYGLLLISASREYGLDDIIFGSKERKAVQKSSVPILLVNPRGDLYALCD
ncbi:MAG: universal stress protein, partial [Prevotellaceae bacterium]|nr:universal stress protein [Prevotellaceae bacterium]